LGELEVTVNSRKLHLMKGAVAALGVAGVMAIGCSTSKQTMAIPFPTSTPFDQSALGRTTYLEAFRDGYVAVKRGLGPPVQVVSRLDAFAYELGYRAGVAAARSQ
jgi:hypothetical protein